MAFKKDEESFIHEAYGFLDRPSFLIRIANMVGKPLEMAMNRLPAKQQLKIHVATEAAIKKGLLAVTKTIAEKSGLQNSFVQSDKSSQRLRHWHSLASFGVGAAGGFFGLFALPIELPVTTAIILRSIVAIADEFGMDLNDPQIQLECMYILSLGSPQSSADDAFGSAYWSSRLAFSSMANEAASFLAGKTSAEIARELEKKSAPVLVKFIAHIAARFEIVVNEKFLAEALPVVGAIGGGLVNAAFTDYFGAAARYHFGLRALENLHGKKTVQDYYTGLKLKSSEPTERNS